MVPRDQFVNKIRALHYTYKQQLKRTFQYRKVGGTHYIYVPMADLLEEEFVTSALQQAGCTLEEIRAFLSSAKN